MYRIKTYKLKKKNDKIVVGVKGEGKISDIHIEVYRAFGVNGLTMYRCVRALHRKVQSLFVY